jgi:hypothetical protein
LDDIDFDFLHGAQTQDELKGSQLGGVPPTWTQEGAGTQPGGSQLPGASGGMQPSPRGVSWVVPAGGRVGGGDGDTVGHN